MLWGEVICLGFSGAVRNTREKSREGSFGWGFLFDTFLAAIEMF